VNANEQRAALKSNKLTVCHLSLIVALVKLIKGGVHHLIKPEERENPLTVFLCNFSGLFPDLSRFIGTLENHNKLNIINYNYSVASCIKN